MAPINLHINIPMREPDLVMVPYQFWFDEMVGTCSNSNMVKEPIKLAICPLTGCIMYMDEYFPRKWEVLESLVLKDIFKEYVARKFEEIMLCTTTK